jgi:hypothetical protein
MIQHSSEQDTVKKNCVQHERRSREKVRSSNFVWATLKELKTDCSLSLYASQLKHHCLENGRIVKKFRS